MEYGGRLVEGVFLERENRFRARVKVDGREQAAHVPNSGRMRELLVPGALLALRIADNPQRKTPCDLLQVHHAGHWVGVDSRTPPRLAAEALAARLITGLQGWQVIRSEPPFGSGRADLLLKRGEQTLFLETKSVNLVIDKVACFPDAPTTRGTRHVREMADHVSDGGRAAIVFIVQRADATAVRPYHEADPEFAQACRDAAATGLPFHAVACRAAFGSISAEKQIPILLDR